MSSEFAIPAWLFEIDEFLLRRTMLETLASSGMGEASNMVLHDIVSDFRKLPDLVASDPGTDRDRAVACLEALEVSPEADDSAGLIRVWTWIARYQLKWTEGGPVHRIPPRQLAHELSRSTGAYLPPSAGRDGKREDATAVVLSALVDRRGHVLVQLDPRLVNGVAIPACLAVTQYLHECLGSTGFERANPLAGDQTSDFTQITLGRLLRHASRSLPGTISVHLDRPSTVLVESSLMFLVATCCGLPTTRHLTSPDEAIHARRVGKREQAKQEEWSSTLSMADAIRILDQHRAELPEVVLPAVGALVNSVREKRRPDRSNPFDELRELAQLDAETLQSNAKRINRVLQRLSGESFASAAILRVAIADIHRIQKLGQFDLTLTENCGSVTAGERINLTSDKASTKRPRGRMVAVAAENSLHTARRTSVLPLQVISKNSSETA